MTLPLDNLPILILDVTMILFLYSTSVWINASNILSCQHQCNGSTVFHALVWDVVCVDEVTSSKPDRQIPRPNKNKKGPRKSVLYVKKYYATKRPDSTFVKNSYSLHLLIRNQSAKLHKITQFYM